MISKVFHKTLNSFLIARPKLHRLFTSTTPSSTAPPTLNLNPKYHQQLTRLSDLMQHSSNVTGKDYMIMKDKVEAALAPVLEHIAGYRAEQLLAMARALQKRSRAFRVRRELTSKIQEAAERRFIQLLPELKTMDSLEVFTELYNLRKIFRLWKPMFAHFKTVEFSGDELLRLVEVMSFRQHLDSSAYKGIYQMLQKTPDIPQTAHFLHLVGRLHFNINYPFYAHPPTIVKMIPSIHAKFPSMTCSQKSFLFKSYRYFFDHITSQQFNQLYASITKDNYKGFTITDLKNLYDSLKFFIENRKSIDLQGYKQALFDRLQNHFLYDLEYFWRSISMMIDNDLLTKEQQQQRMRRLLESTLLTVPGKLREKIKPFEYLISVHEEVRELREIMMGLERRAETPVECARLSFIHEKVCPEVGYTQQDRLEGYVSTNPILVLESMNRSYFKRELIEPSKKELFNCKKVLDIHNENTANVYANALLSSYEIPELRDFWWSQLGLLNALEQSVTFVFAVFKQLTSDRHTFKQHHMKLITDIYMKSSPTNHTLIIKNVAPLLKMVKTLGPVKYMDKDTLFDFLRAYTHDPLIYSNLQNQYCIIRMLQSLRDPNQFNPLYQSLLSKSFMDSYLNIGFESTVMTYYLRHMDVLVERKDISADAIQLFLEFLKPRKDATSLISRLQLLRKEGVEKNRKGIEEVKEVVKGTREMGWVGLLWREPTEKDVLTRAQALELTRPGLGLTAKTLDFLLKFINPPLSQSRLIKLIKDTNTIRKLPSTILWLVSAFQLHQPRLYQPQLLQTIQSLTKQRVLLPQTMRKLARQTRSIYFLNPCYQLGFLDPSIDQYIQRIFPYFIERIRTAPLSDQLRTLQNYICYTLLKIHRGKKISQFQAKVLDKCIFSLHMVNKKNSGLPEDRRVKIPVDIRFGVCLDVVERVCGNEVREGSMMMGELVRNQGTGVFLEQYNKFAAKAMTQKAKALLESLGYKENDLMIQGSHAQNSPYFWLGRNAVVILPREYQLRGSMEQGVGDFCLIKKYIELLFVKGKEVRVVSAQKLVEPTADMFK